jgi:hypothetical protein
VQAPPLQVRVFCLFGLLAEVSLVVRATLLLRLEVTVLLSVVRDLVVTAP